MQVKSILKTSINVFVRKCVTNALTTFINLGCYAILDPQYEGNYDSYSIWDKYIIYSCLDFIEIYQAIESLRYFVVDVPYEMRLKIKNIIDENKKMECKPKCLRRRSNSCVNLDCNKSVTFYTAKKFGFVTLLK